MSLYRCISHALELVYTQTCIVSILHGLMFLTDSCNKSVFAYYRAYLYTRIYASLLILYITKLLINVLELVKLEICVSKWELVLESMFYMIFIMR